MDGLDRELGLGDEELHKEDSENEVVSFEEGKKKVKKAFHYWNVAGKDYKLKLTTQMIGRLEDKYRTNVMNIVSIDGMPRLNVMLTIIQAALDPWHHGMKFSDVQALYDRYLSEGGNQVKLLSDVVMPVLAVSGFFTENQTEALMDQMKAMDDTMI